MPRLPRVHPDSLLVCFAEAAVMLGVTRDKVTSLVYEGKIKAHPVLAERIARAEIERFCSYSQAHETDEESGRPVDDGTPQEVWDVPPLRLRKDA